MSFVPYAQPQFWADLHKIWRVAFLYPTHGRGERVSKRRSSPARAIYMPLQMTAELRREMQN